MSDSAAPAAAAAAAATPIEFHRSDLPTGQTMHSIYLRQITGAQVQTLQTQGATNAMDFALINADLVSQRTQSQCPAR